MKWYRIILPFILAMLIAYLIGNWFDERYRRRWDILFFQKTDELIKKKDHFDVVLLGNSRVHFGINPYYLDSVTGLSSYNFANGGADVIDMLLTSKLFMKHHPRPKYVLISADPGMLKRNESLKTLYHYLFYLKDDSMRRYMQMAGFPTLAVRYIPFLKYAIMDEYNRTSIFVQGHPYPIFDHNNYRGFLNISKDTGKQSQRLYHTERYSNDSIWHPAINLLDELITVWKGNKVQVIFVYPPEKQNAVFQSWKFYKEGISIFDSVAKSNKIDCFHFERDRRFKDAYFVDDIHLNNPGATMYSIMLGDSVLRIK